MILKPDHMDNTAKFDYLLGMEPGLLEPHLQQPSFVAFLEQKKMFVLSFYKLEALLCPKYMVSLAIILPSIYGQQPRAMIVLSGESLGLLTNKFPIPGLGGFVW